MVQSHEHVADAVEEPWSLRPLTYNTAEESDNSTAPSTPTPKSRFAIIHQPSSYVGSAAGKQRDSTPPPLPPRPPHQPSPGSISQFLHTSTPPIPLPPPPPPFLPSPAPAHVSHFGFWGEPGPGGHAVLTVTCYILCYYDLPY